MKLTDKIRHWIIGGLIVLLTVMVFNKYHDVMEFKFEEGIAHFYNQPPDTIDVFIVGSSHVFCNIDPAVLWSENGIASYVLSGGGQPIWNSYYYIKESLNYQNPKLIIFEAFCSTLNYDYIDDRHIIENTVGMRFGKNKLLAYKAGVQRNKRIDFAFEYIQYHNKYKFLKPLDYDLTYSKGFSRYALFRIATQKIPIWSENDKYMTLNTKQERYFRKIIDLCKEKNIPLLVIVTPYSHYNKNDHEKYNMVKKITAEYGVPFYNFHDPIYLAKIGFDWQKDFADNSHMNYSGSRKFSHFFAALLKEHYSDILLDHRGDPRYTSWDKNSHYMDNYGVKFHLVNTNDANSYTNYLDTLSDEYIIFVNVSGKIPENWYAGVKNWLIKYGIPYDKAHSECVWVINKSDGAKKFSKGKLGYYYLSSYDGMDLIADKGGIYFNDNSYTKVSDGINIVIFDRYSQHITDAIGINKKGINR